MSSTPAEYPQQLPPPMFMGQQAYSGRPGHGSIGPVIAVLAVIAVLGAIAVMIGRLCSGRRIMGHGQYDFEGWVETKCASCIDGRVDPIPRPVTVTPPPPPVVVAESSSSGSPGDAAAAPVPETVETREEEVSNQQSNSHEHHERADS
ncbi:hypothetical protein P3S67_019895 [Capsicum chacoense]|uniref:uncharacterized protein LOC107879982 n=1 Tax=Capsicum annuum TaxID=4072 RepID=UPI0007BECF34|nr:uncharacterized protein LOC107879982 [Capsicum annuum]KAF3616007.1 putative peptidyl-prolyl cis-trans isomerase CYP40-like [Capsicum annuum]KAF3633746.1 putative peptidyl-prolyl cis-trans isomerase CYP40-like [Capsicum annuum]